METIHAYFDGSVFVPLSPVKAKPRQPAIITILDDVVATPQCNRYIECFGALSSEGYAELIEALKDTERVDANEW